MDKVLVERWGSDGRWLDVHLSGDFHANLERVRAVPGRRFDKGRKTWQVPATTAALHAVRDLWRGQEVEFGVSLKAIVEQANAEVAARRTRDLDSEPEPVPGAITPPWRHQARAFQFASASAGALLNMGLGTGKSKVVVDLVNQGTFHTVLILCPKSVCGVWPRQFRVHGNKKAMVLGFDEAPMTTARKRGMCAAAFFLTAREHRPFVLVLNYESARVGFSGRKDTEKGSLAEWILDMSWDLVVLDESHRVKDPRGLTSKFIALLATARKRLCLSGTPMPHGPLDIWSQFRFLDIGIFGSSFVLFRARYAVMGGYLGKQILGYQNQQELAELMARITFSARTEDVLDLPPFVDVDREFRLNAEEAKTYKALETNFIAEVKNGTVVASNALTRLLRLQQVVSGYVTVEPDDGRPVRVDFLGDSRQNLLEDMLQDIDPSEPVVVFCRFHIDLDSVWRVANKLEREYKELSGRRNDLDQGVWTKGQILGVQIQAGGVGVDLTRARYCVFYSIGYSLGDYEQARARVRRPGQTRPVTYVHVQAVGTIDEVVRDALNKKRDVVEHVLSFCRGTARPRAVLPISQGGAS